MTKILDWHTWVGDTGRRLALLQLLWLGHTLLGGVVLGVFPATAALFAVLRRDRMVADGWVGAASRPRLAREFHEAWRRELVPANAVGLVLTAGWAFVLVDHRLLRTVEIAMAPALQVLLWIVTAVLLCVTGTVWVLQSHFTDGPFAVLRRALVLTVARPLVSLGCAAVLAVTACVGYLVPGLVVVFGAVLPAAAIVGWVWHTGVLPRATTEAPAVTATVASAHSRATPDPIPAGPASRRAAESLS